MRHRASLRKNHFRRGLHRHLGLVAWYKYASQYGESYLRPVLWLLAVMLFFACLYPVVGLQYQPSRDRAQTQSGGVNTSSVMSAQVRDPAVLTYSSPLRPGDNGHGSLLRARLRLWSHSLGASFFVSVFQRELVYDPVYPWGRVLAALEQALVSIFFALFILALRRQFRR